MTGRLALFIVYKIYPEFAHQIELTITQFAMRAYTAANHLLRGLPAFDNL